ncbi:MAG: hypothetical protein JXB26_09150 [Candidatus Aminicenantes bacterium]|nr:hypothetical protein [Candidatus Aminicenantes bacterium]
MRKMTIAVLAAGILCLISASAERRTFDSSDWQAFDKETIRKTLTFPDTSGRIRVQVDNIFGFIEVAGTSGNEVQLVVTKTIKARTKSRAEKAKEEVVLDITEEDNIIDIYVNGPFRCRNERKNRWDPGYKVIHNFELKIPQRADVFLKTVTDGHITVKNVQGNFDVRNVNGRITMEEMGGSGDAHTVNGKVHILFSRNPDSDCSFKTVNGDLDLFFPDGLSADFYLKTFNGEAYSDFPATLLPYKMAKTEKKNGKYVYKSTRFSRVRIGGGGPEIKMDTLNGDLLINKK